MIAGIFHQGSGLGNQLHRYVATRALAADKGVDFGMVAPELFKGKDFMKLDLGRSYGQQDEIGMWGAGWTMGAGGEVIPLGDIQRFKEHKMPTYDPLINFVQDHTVIDGNFEDPRYFEHRLDEVNEWLKVESLDMPDDVCVIGFRGGEYTAVPELFLPKKYWDTAIAKIRTICPSVRFEVHTDDLVTADQFFPDFPIIHDVGFNWRSMRYAKYATIANSSFYILPRLLNGGLTIAPKYWNRYNLKRWDFPQNYYKQFTYI